MVPDKQISMADIEALPSTTVGEMTKHVETDGVGHTPSLSDKVYFRIDVRYSEGSIVEIKTRKQINKYERGRSPIYPWLQQALDSMAAGETSWFKLDFPEEEKNPYLPETEEARKAWDVCDK